MAFGNIRASLLGLLLLGLGFFLGRMAPSGAPSLQATKAIKQVANASPPNLQAHAGPAAKLPDLPAAKAERIHEIDEELSDMRNDNAERLKALAGEIAVDRDLISELRSRLNASDRALMQQSQRAGASQGSERWLAYQQEAFALNQKLVDAKAALADQQRLLQVFEGSDEDTKTMREVRAELARRQANVKQAQGEIEEFFQEESNGMQSEADKESAILRAWRMQKAELEADYANAISELAQANRDYQELATAAHEEKQRADNLNKEKKALLGSSALPDAGSKQ